MVICICKTIKPNCILLFYKNINRLIPTPNFIRKKYILNLYNINRNMMHGCYNRNDYNKVKYYFTNVFLRQHKEKMQETFYIIKLLKSNHNKNYCNCIDFKYIYDKDGDIGIILMYDKPSKLLNNIIQDTRDNYKNEYDNYDYDNCENENVNCENDNYENDNYEYDNCNEEIHKDNCENEYYNCNKEINEDNCENDRDNYHQNYNNVDFYYYSDIINNKKKYKNIDSDNETELMDDSDNETELMDDTYVDSDNDTELMDDTCTNCVY